MNATFNGRKAGKISKSIAGFALTALLSIAATAQVATGTTGIDATGNAASEMAACNNGTSQQAKATCITEVQNANAAKRAGQIDNAGGQFAANARERCKVLTGEEQIACEARVAGLGNTQGSVAGGGAITEVETVVVPRDATNVLIQPQTASTPIVVIPASQ